MDHWNKSAESRRLEREEGLAFARRWRDGRNRPPPPQAYTGPYPFRGMTCAEWREED